MFKIHNIFLFHNDRFTFYYTQSVSYPGNFWSQYTGLGAQKMSPKNRAVLHQEVSFFYQTDNLISFVLSLLKVGHLTRLLLSQVWYDRRKPRRFHTKKKKKQQPKLPCAIITFYRTCDRWPFKKTWTLFMRYSELLISIRNSCWGGGGMDC